MNGDDRRLGDVWDLLSLMDEESMQSAIHELVQLDLARSRFQRECEAWNAAHPDCLPRGRGLTYNPRYPYIGPITELPGEEAE